MSDYVPASFVRADLAVFCGLDKPSLMVEGMREDAGERDGRRPTMTLACRAIEQEFDRFCPLCDNEGRVRDTRSRTFSRLPYGQRSTLLRVRYRRYRCDSCSRPWSQDPTRIAPPRLRLTHAAAWRATQALARDKPSVTAVARHLAACWDAAWNAIAHVAALLLSNPKRFEAIRAIGIDEHVWRHKPGTDPYVTIIVDLTPTLEHAGPARLLAMIDGQAAKAVEAWLDNLPLPVRDTIEAIAMDGLAAYKKAAKAQAGHATIILDPFHVTRWAGQKVSAIRKRLTIETFGRRGRAGEGLYDARKTLLTRRAWLTPTRRHTLAALFAVPHHKPLHEAWRIYQHIREAYEHEDPMVGRMLMARIIDSIKPGTGQTVPEITSPGRTMYQHRTDILNLFDYRRITNGPVEAINGRIEHLRGIGLGFTNHTNYETRTLLHSGQIHHPHH